MYCYKQYAENGTLIAIEQRQTEIKNLPENMEQITETEYNEILESLVVDEPEETPTPTESPYQDAIAALETLGYTEV